MKTLSLVALGLLAAGIPVSAFAGAPAVAVSPSRPVTLSTLTPDQRLQGFTTLCVYTGDAGKPIGARFRHTRTGFIFDYLQMESVPQAFIYVNTVPTSDKGEPHTQEHLLLGKGNKGRSVASAEAMTLSESSAYTEQWRTCFFFNTTAGVPVFYDQLRMRLDALLHPDYTDEEVRREVRNFGIAENPDKTLRLEEKGTVYNEMVSTMDKSDSQLFRSLGIDEYGANHPFAFESGGTPEALRTLTPDEIRAFRNRDYYLGNMGMVAAFPGSASLSSVLGNVNTVLDKLQPAPNRPDQPFVSVPKFPKPQPAPAGALQIVSFPDANAEQPGEITLAWPPTRTSFSVADNLLIGLFFSNLAGDADTPLYKRFIDAKTRTIDTGATGIYGYTPDDLGNPVYIGLSDVKASFITETGIESVRKAVVAELNRIAALSDGSPELLSFNQKLRTRMQAARRDQSKFVNSPPGFGARLSNSAWMDTCRLLERTPGFHKSVLLAPEYESLEKRLSGKKNLWRTLLPEWGITTTTPYVVAAKADPGLVTRQAEERQARSDAEVARLKAVYGTTSDQETIRRYKQEYDAETARLEAIARHASASTHFLKQPPLSLDSSLQYRQTKIAHGVPLFAATFDTMTSATTKLYLRLNGVTPEDRVYLAALPTLLDNTGVIENGKALSYEQSLQRMRQEILSEDCSFATNPRAGRYELAVTVAGNDTAEARRSLLWMKRFLTAPNWQPDNLPRLRDVVDQQLESARNRMLGQEEYWVRVIGSAWQYQSDPLALSTDCFLTQAHDLHRLRWMLKAAPTPADRAAFIAYLDTLSGAGQDAPNRPTLDLLLKTMNREAVAKDSLPASLARYSDAYAKLPPGAQALARDANGDLDRILGDLPDDSRAADWSYLCQQISADFAQGPEVTLKKLTALRLQLLRADNARLAIVGSAATEAQLRPDLNQLVSVLTAAPAPAGTRARWPIISNRVRERVPGAQPVFVGLVGPSMKGGTVMNEAPIASYRSFDDPGLLRLLAANLYGGGGASSVFIKTWGAGLAYSNGISTSPNSGQVSYYADHTPELPQTVRFVVDTVKGSPRDPGLIEYAFAGLFRSQESADYESRAFIMADELADGTTPALVRAFRTHLLSLRRRPDLTNSVYERLPGVMETILPGYGGKTSATTNGHYVVIGPENQLAAYENYLHTADSPQTTLYRLYPRDFWITQAK